MHLTANDFVFNFIYAIVVNARQLFIECQMWPQQRNLIEIKGKIPKSLFIVCWMNESDWRKKWNWFIIIYYLVCFSWRFSFSRSPSNSHTFDSTFIIQFRCIFATPFSLFVPISFLLLCDFFSSEDFDFIFFCSFFYILTPDKYAEILCALSCSLEILKMRIHNKRSDHIQKNPFISDAMWWQAEVKIHGKESNVQKVKKNDTKGIETYESES